MHKLSVVIAVYNVSEYIEACLTSVLEQNYKNVELIIVNDGSTDDTFQKVEKLVDGHTNVILIDQENQGVSAVRNNGVKAATGDYLGFVDGDDIIAKDMFQKMMDSFEMSNADMVTIGVARLSGDKVYPSTLHERYMVEKKKPQQLKKHRHFYMILLRGIKYLKNLFGINTIWNFQRAKCMKISH